MTLGDRGEYGFVTEDAARICPSSGRFRMFGLAKRFVSCGEDACMGASVFIVAVGAPWVPFEVSIAMALD